MVNCDLSTITILFRSWNRCCSCRQLPQMRDHRQFPTCTTWNLDTLVRLSEQIVLFELQTWKLQEACPYLQICNGKLSWKFLGGSFLTLCYWRNECNVICIMCRLLKYKYECDKGKEGRDGRCKKPSKIALCQLLMQYLPVKIIKIRK